MTRSPDVCLPPDVIFEDQDALIDLLIEQRDRAEALAMRLAVLALVMWIVAGAMFSLWWLA